MEEPGFQRTEFLILKPWLSSLREHIFEDIDIGNDSNQALILINSEHRVNGPISE